MLRVKSGYLGNLILGLFLICGLIGLFLSFHYPTHQNKTSYQRVNIVTVSEPKSEIVETRILTDEDLGRLYNCKEDTGTDTTIELTIEDAQALMRIAVVEDFTSVESQANVMAVVLNRVNDPKFPNTIQGVIEQPGQFSTVSNGAYYNAEPDINSHLALAMIEKGEVETDALYFESAKAKGTWQSENLVYISTVGGTRYYR